MSHFIKKVEISPQINQLLKDEIKEEKNFAVDPPQEKIAQLFNLYNLEKYEELLHESKFLIDLFPESLVMRNIIAGAYAGLKIFDQSILHFKKILEINPLDAVAHFNIGSIQKELKEYENEIKSYQSAISINPNFPEAFNNMGNALKAKGDLESAILEFKKALKLRYNFPEAHYNLGVVLYATGQIVDAIDSYKIACRIKPNYINSYLNMGNALMDIKDFRQAIVIYKKVIKIKPALFEAYLNLGKAFQAQGDLDLAINIYEKALQIKPDYAEAYLNKGNTLRDKGDLDAALENFNQALEICPNYAEAINNLGFFFMESGDFDAAIGKYKKAIEIKPAFAEAYGNMGIAYKEKGELDLAIENLNQAIQIDPKLPDFHNSAGLVHRDTGDLEAALNSYQQAIKLDPEDAKAYWNQCLAYLTKGDFEKGWPEYEWRWKAKEDMMGKYISTSKPIWNYSRGQRVLLWAEQGIGDEVMFASIIPELHALCSKLIVNLDERLIPIFRRSFPNDIEYSSREKPISETEYDAHIPMGSLPQYFRQAAESFKKSSQGWLFADEKKTNNLRQKLLVDETETLIGISWHSTTPRLGAEAKVLSLSQLAKTLYTPKTKLINLQYGDVSEEIERLKNEHGIEVIQLPEIDNTNDLDGLASLIMACDKVVSISNFSIHLAGALGKQAHVLLAYCSDWRWGQKPNSNYWYDSVCLHRQTIINDWKTALNKLH